jgi:hypothetical protein
VLEISACYEHVFFCPRHDVMPMPACPLRNLASCSLFDLLLLTDRIVQAAPRDRDWFALVLALRLFGSRIYCHLGSPLSNGRMFVIGYLCTRISAQSVCSPNMILRTCFLYDLRCVFLILRRPSSQTAYQYSPTHRFLTISHRVIHLWSVEGTPCGIARLESFRSLNC